MEDSDPDEGPRVPESDNDSDQCPRVPPIQTFSLSKQCWDKIEAGARTSTDRKNLRIGGRGWRDGIVEKVMEAIPFCQLSRNSINLHIWGGDTSRQPGNYAYFTTKCLKKTKEDEECCVRVKVYVPSYIT